MVYGRYNELVNGDYFMVYKPTFTSLGGPHPVVLMVNPHLLGPSLDPKHRDSSGSGAVTLRSSEMTCRMQDIWRNRGETPGIYLLR